MVKTGLLCEHVAVLAIKYLYNRKNSEKECCIVYVTILASTEIAVPEKGFLECV